MEEHAYADGIRCVDGREVVKLESDRISLAVSKNAGEWMSLAVDGAECINHRCSPQVPVDFKVDGRWLIESQRPSGAGT